MTGGVLVTTTAGKQWNKEAEQVYRRDVGEEQLQVLRSKEFSDISSNFSASPAFEKSIAELFIK
jgi:hypothetical protein